MTTVGKKIIIVEMLIFSDNSGHALDYLDALKEALSGHDVETLAPFSAQRRRTIDGSRLLKISRLWRYIRTYRSLLLRGDTDLIILPTPLFMDSVAYFCAYLSIIRRNFPLGLFVLRRESEALSQSSQFKVWLMNTCLQILCKRKHVYPISDSKFALKNWGMRLGVHGSEVSIPLRLNGTKRVVDHEAGIKTIGLIGAARFEKGLAHYDRIISCARAALPEAVIKIQLPDDPSDSEREVVDLIRDNWALDTHVNLIPGYLTNDEYALLVSETDAVILPYEVDAYGSGTSGILHEFLSSGGLAVSTKIVWAFERYCNDPRVIWLQDLCEQTICSALSELNNRYGYCLEAGDGFQNEEDFSKSWQMALIEAEEWRAS
jgi:hypothetical protein